MGERDENELKERIMLVQALPEEAAERFLSARGALHHTDIASRLDALYNPPKDPERD